MQLPRGRFHRLIKSTTTRALMEEMGSKQFTGICMIVPGSGSAVLVFDEGLVVLAEYGGIKGQQVLETIQEGIEGEVAAELNLLTPEQIQLTLEFNPSFATGIQKDSPPGKATPGGVRSFTNPGKTPATPVSKHRTGSSAERRRIPMPGVKSAQETTAPPPLSGDGEIDALIRNMEEIDVDQLVSNFRVDCKTMLKKIHLDHLIQEKDA